MATYVISDVHGWGVMFESILKKIHFSSEDNLYVIGDVIDRGPESIMCMQRIMNAPNIDLILGNHEFMMLNTLSPTREVSKSGLSIENSSLWLDYNGGMLTYDQCCNLNEKDRNKLLYWLSNRPVSIKLTVNKRSYILTHSGFNETALGKTYNDLDYETIFNIVWKSPYREGSDTHIGHDVYRAHPDCIFITGHVPVGRMSHKSKLTAYNDPNASNLWDIDGGCALINPYNFFPEHSTGIICLRLDDMQEFVVTFKEVADKIGVL